MRDAGSIGASARSSALGRAGILLGLAAAYLLTAKLGLSLALWFPQVSPVWPATGLALAALLRLGLGVWPAVFVGALVANATTGEPLGTAAVIAVGNTLEAVAGAWLLRRVGFRPGFERVRDVVALVLVAALGSTLLSAGLGVAGLCLGGLAPWSRFAELFRVWWLGDGVGALVVAPLLLAWSDRAARRRALGRPLELALLLGGLVLVAVGIFSVRLIATPAHPTLAYAVFPFVLWAALRFGQAGASLATAAASLVAILGVLEGGGPFTSASAHHSLMLVQLFLAVVAVTGLLLAAAAAERDDAEARRAEAGRLARERLEAEAGFRRAIEGSIPAGIAAVGADGRQTYVNPAFARMVGWTAEELTGAPPPFVYWPTEEQPAIERAFAATLRGEAAGVERLRFRRRDGERFDALVQIAPMAGGRGEPGGWVASVSDVTDQVRTETALRREEERYRSLVAASAQVVWTTTAEGEVTGDLPQWRQLTGQSREELEGRGWLAMIHPDDREAVTSVWERSLATGTPHATELRVRARDGSWRPMLSRAVPVREPDGRLREWVGTLTDVSEQRRLEDELRHRVEELAEAGRSKDEFLAMLGHELRNPLAPITTALHLMREQAPGGIVGERLLPTLERQVRQLTRLVDDLLDVSRITRREIALRRERTDLDAPETDLACPGAIVQVPIHRP